jgi:hypothetical protein
VLGKRPGAVRTAAYRGLRRLAERLNTPVSDDSDGPPAPEEERSDGSGGAQPPPKRGRSRKTAPAPEASQSRTSSAAEARGPAGGTDGVQWSLSSTLGGGPAGRSAMPVPPESPGDGSEASDTRSEASGSRQVAGGLRQGGSGALGEASESASAPVGRAGRRGHDDGAGGAARVPEDGSGCSPASDADVAPDGTDHARGGSVSMRMQGDLGRRPPAGSTAGNERGTRRRAFGRVWMGALRGRSAWWAGALGATGPLGAGVGFPADNAFSLFGRLGTGGAGTPGRPRSHGLPRRSGGSGPPGGPAEASR